MKTKKFFSFLLTLALMLTSAPVATTRAAEKQPYAHTYDWARSMEYYFFGTNGIAVADSSRSVSYPDSTVVLNGKLLTDRRLAGTQPFWHRPGSHLFWVEIDGVRIYIFGTRMSVLLPSSAGAILVEGSDGFLGSIKLADGTSLTPEQAIAKLPVIGPGGVVGATATPSAKPTVAPTATPTAKPLVTPSPTAKVTAKPVVTVPPAPTPTSTPHGVLIGKPTATPATATGKVTPFLDATGRMHYTFGSHEIIVDGANVYADGIRISELCNSGVRYLGAVPEGVYLLEDSAGAYYRFSWDNLFCPEKLKFADGCVLLKVIFDDQGYMTHLETSTGTYALSQLVVDEEWAPSFTYAINKTGYCQFYWAESGTGYLLEIKGESLFLGSTLVASGVTKTQNSIGVDIENPGYFLVTKGTQTWTAPWSNPTKLVLKWQNVARLEYSSKNGLVTKPVYLEQKLDWCKNSSKKTVLYQSSIQACQLTLNSSKTKVLLDGRVIAQLSKKERKAGKKYSFVGITEQNSVAYGVANKAGWLVSAKKIGLEQAKTCKVNAAKSWKVTTTSYDGRGFLVGH